MEELDQLPPDSVRGALEAMLLVAADPVSAVDLARVLGIAPGECVSLLADLSAEYADAGRGFQLRQVAGGWRLYTHPAYHQPVEELIRSWDTRKLSQAALETLAVIAYHQPVTREGVKAIRGVNSEGVVSSLVDKGLVRETGREKARSGAILYGTTRSFLERFGLASLKELPPLEDFAPDEEARRFIRERLGGSPGLRAVEEAAEDLAEQEELLSDVSGADEEVAEASVAEALAGEDAIREAQADVREVQGEMEP